jgi:hypothetical protein
LERNGKNRSKAEHCTQHAFWGQAAKRIECPIAKPISHYFGYGEGYLQKIVESAFWHVLSFFPFPSVSNDTKTQNNRIASNMVCFSIARHPVS